MAHLTARGKIVNEYITKFPRTSTRGLARLIYRDHKAFFKSENKTRDLIRKHRVDNARIIDGVIV